MKLSVENGVVIGTAENLQDVQVLLTLGTEVKPRKKNGVNNGVNGEPKKERKKRGRYPTHPTLPGKLEALAIEEGFFISTEDWGRGGDALYASVFSFGHTLDRKYKTRTTEGGWNITRIK